MTDALFENDHALKYLEGRGLTLDTIVAAQFGYVKRGRFRNSIAIPYFDGLGRHRSTRYRRLDPDAPRKYDWLKGSKSHVYGIEDVNAPVVHITEGEFDRWILKQIGLSSVGLDGAQHFQRPWRFLFRNCDLVLVVMDNDPSKVNEEGREIGMTGQRAAQKIAAAIGTVTNVDIIELPSDKDCTDVYLESPDLLRSLCDVQA